MNYKLKKELHHLLFKKNNSYNLIYTKKYKNFYCKSIIILFFLLLLLNIYVFYFSFIIKYKVSNIIILFFDYYIIICKLKNIIIDFLFLNIFFKELNKIIYFRQVKKLFYHYNSSEKNKFSFKIFNNVCSNYSILLDEQLKFIYYEYFISKKNTDFTKTDLKEKKQVIHQ